MFPDLSKISIYIRPGHTDMRKAINGLAMAVTEDMFFDPLNGSLYLFSNKQRKIMKALYWDRNGFCLWQKKLEKHRFPWPKTEDAARKINADQLSMLLSGIDFWNAHTELKYCAVS
jgi:transposase